MDWDIQFVCYIYGLCTVCLAFMGCLTIILSEQEPKKATVLY